MNTPGKVKERAPENRQLLRRVQECFHIICVRALFTPPTPTKSSTPWGCDYLNLRSALVQWGLLILDETSVRTVKVRELRAKPSQGPESCFEAHILPGVCAPAISQPLSGCAQDTLRPWTSLMAAVCSAPTCSPLQASMLRQEDWDCAPLSSAAFKEEIVAENPLFGWKKVRKTLLREKNFEWVYTGNHVKDIGIVTDKCQWLEKKN